MTEFPPLTICIQTFRRLDELARTIDALHQNVLYPRDKLTWLIGDDASGGEFTERYKDLIRRYHGLLGGVRVISTLENGGWGASANNAMKYITTPYVYHTDDDFILTRPLDLEIGVALLEAEKHIGMLRYASLAGSEKYVYQQHEADLRAWFDEPLSGAGARAGVLVYLTLAKESPSLYLYSQTPQLVHKARWFDYYGAFPTGVMLGEGEEKYCHHVKDKLLADDSAPQIAVLPEWIPMHYQIVRPHSWQYSEFDVRRGVAE